MQNNNYQILIEKLDAFIRKYYVNNIIRGSLHSIALISVMWTTFVLLEHYVFTSSVSSIAFRKALFYTFSLTAAAALGTWVIYPLIQYFKLGKVISHEKAAEIIGEHFTNVKDKLLNVLQLKAMSEQENSILLIAAVNQKTEELKPVPFKKAIDLKENRKYLRFVLPPLFLFLGLLLSSNIIQNSTKRIFNSDKEFEREAPFAFLVKNLDAKVVQFDDFTLEVEVQDKGALPSEVYIEVDNYKYKMEKSGPAKYKYTFYKMQKDASFRLSANGFGSKKYDIDVLEKPNILDLAVRLKYPSYTGRRDENVSNVGDLAVPAGTDIEWLFGADNTDALSMLFPGEINPIAAQRSDKKLYTVRKKVMQDGVYKIFISNSLLPNADSVSYTLTVIPDLYPSIELQKFPDSTDNRVVYLAGEASDDYGIRSLSLHYTIERDGKILKQEARPMAIAAAKQTTYDYTLNMRSFELKAGDKFSYYFQVWDNDAVQGSKSSKTPMMFYQMPTIDEVEKQEENNNEQIKSDLEKAMKEMEKLQQSIKKAKEGVLQKNELNWQDRREIEKLLEQQKEAEDKIKQAQENFKENLKNQEEFQKVDPELLEKQKMLEELFEQIMSDELKELFEKMEEMLDNLNKDQILEQMKEMELNDEKLKNELDRMLELFKKMEVEKEMTDAINQLDSLAKKQDDLSKETEKNENANNPEKQKDLQDKQDKLNKEFEKIQEKLDKANEKNEKLEQPMDIDPKELEQQEKEIKEEQENSSQQLNQKQNKNASKSQKNAGQKMKKMSDAMKQMMQMNQMQQMEQDVKAMRQLLENLVNMSFDQEKLIDDVNKSIPNTPAYTALVREQFKLKDDFRHIEDSLNVLAKRVFQLQGFITEKVTDVKKSINKSIEQLEAREKRNATVNQQFAMTYVNDLALMLSESMKQMQQQMAQQMPGQQMCEKPGDGEDGEGKTPGKKGKKPGMGGMKEMQDQLNQQIEQMQQQMKNGKNPSSKEFGEMAAKQAAIRKALQDMKRERQQNGKGGGKELQDLINQMDKTETDLVNKRLPNDLNKRQQEILTRLLEHEKAEKEREYDNERKAEQPKKTEPKIPPAMEEYLKKRKGQVEMFKTVSPALKPYYKNLVEEYFRSLK
jgi:hypothetical protein